MRKRILAVLAVFVSVPMIAAAHGSMETPISRVYNCFKENPESPDSAACQAVVNMSGTQPLYDWNEVNQANAAGNHQAVIPDGTLCGGGRDKYAGLNLARTDWVATNVSSGQTLNMTFHATAPHATQAWTFYITRQGYDLTQPLRWADLEPLCTIGNIPVNNFRYNMSCQLPTSRSGRAIIYNTWQRSDSPEAFYTCIDVSFGGTAVPTPTPTPTAPPNATPTPTPTTPTQPGVVDITPSASGVTASTNDGNLPGNTVDNSLSTRWSGNGDGAWIQYDLGAMYTVSHVNIAVYNGATRRNRFDLQVSSGNGVWTNVLTNFETTGTSTQLETYNFGDVDARFVRYMGHMSNVGTFNSITEFEIWGSAITGPTATPTTPPAATPTPTATPTTPPSSTPTPTPTLPPSSAVEITPPGSAVTASTSDTNVASNTVDNNLGTRWSGNGDGATIQYDLGSTHTISYVKIAVYNGNGRRNRFDLQVSSGNGVWTNVVTNKETSGTTTQLETHDFGDVDARLIRYVGHMSNIGTFNSLTEVEVWGAPCVSCPTPPTPTVTPTPTATPTSGTPTPTPRPIGGWTLRWTGDAAEGLSVFEGLEDDRASSHTSFGPHIRAQSAGYFEWFMHMVDRDGSDRQRHEVKGINENGADIHQLQGSTWMFTYEMYIPSSMTGGERFTHIYQQKMVTDAGSSGGPLITLSPAGGNTILPRVISGFSSLPLSQYWNKWVYIEFEHKFDFGSNGGYARYLARDTTTGTTLTNQTRTGNMFANEGTCCRRVRPKWGIYRSLESSGMKDCFLRIRNMKAYQK